MSPTLTPGSGLEVLGLQEIPLIDRTEEMVILKEIAQRARHGKGSILLLLGEPGIGKTRLARELKNYGRSLGMQVMSGRCPAFFQLGGIPPYSLWVEVIKDYLATCRPETLLKVVGPYPQEVSKLVPELWRKLEQTKGLKQLGITGWMKGPGAASGPSSVSIGPENERFRLLEAVSKFIENVSNHTSCMILLDDLQWADQSSLLMFHYLAQTVSKIPLLLIGIYRDTEIDEKHPFRPVIVEFERERLSKSVHLDRLSFDESVEMIQGLLGGEHVSSEFAKTIYEKTAGNPYFIEEVLRSLIETGGIRRQEKGWKLDETHVIRFPNTVRELIRRRLGRLEDNHLQPLVVASVIGKQFSFDAISQVTGMPEDKLLAIMDNILHTGLVEEETVREEEVYVFSDILVRNVLYEGISRIRRKKLHSAVAQVLETLHVENIEDHFGELAYHFLEGGEKPKALEYFVKAGERAMKVYAHREAFSHFSSALRMLEEKAGNVAERAGLQEKLGDLLVYQGEYREALEYLSKAVDLWGSVEEPGRQASLHTKRAKILWDNMGDKDGASHEHDMALRILEKGPESSELAKLFNDMSWMLWRFGDTEKAKEFTGKAFDIGQRLSDKEVLAHCYGMIGGFDRDAGNFTNWIETYETMLKIALEVNAVETVIIGYDSQAFAHWDFYFNPEKADEYLSKGLEFSKKVGLLRSMAFLTVRKAMFDIDRGEYRRAIHSIEEALTLQTRIGDRFGTAFSLSSIFLAYIRLGELERSKRYLDKELEISNKSPEFQLLAGANFDLGSLLFEGEEYAEAKICLEKSLSILSKSGIFAEFGSRPILAEVYLAKGEYEKASEMIGQLYEVSVKTEWTRMIPVALRLKAMLCRAKGEGEEADRFFSESLQRFESLGARKWLPFELARTLYEFGLTHLERRLEGDREKAQQYLNDALQIFERIEAKRWIEKTRARKVLLEGQEQAKPPTHTVT